jgi:branched-chain amino acid aminotransferase
MSTARLAHLACLDGVVSPAAEAKIPATDEGLLRGDGVFEVLRLYGGRPFALDEHLERLAHSGASLRLPVDLAAVRTDVKRLLSAAGATADHGCLRVVLTRGGRRLLLLESLPAYGPAARLATVTYAPSFLLDGVKSLSYAANMLATRIARERGCDEALFVSPDGRVLEAPTSSIFWVAGGTLRTPPLDEQILASITRAAVLELLAVEERPCTLRDLWGADEAFIVSTTREVQAVAAVDDRELPCGPSGEGGPATSDAARRLQARIAASLI